MTASKSDGDAFTEAINQAPTPRRRMLVDQFLVEMPDDVAERRRAVLMDPKVTPRQCVAGFAAIGKQIGETAVRNWRHRNGLR